MNPKPTQIFFAGGGTGGHIYPALAVAEQVTKEQGVEAIFFCSNRAVDARVLAQAPYEFFPLPVEGFSSNPIKMLRFGAGFLKSYAFAKQVLQAVRREAVVVGCGGFVSGPVVLAARSLKIPIYILNVDYVPGKANRLMGRLARTIFAQYDQTGSYFGNYRDKVVAVGCPLRSAFDAPQPDNARQALGLETTRKTLLVTGASSGALSINQAMLKIAAELAAFADDWQVVHLTGRRHFQAVQDATAQASIPWYPVDYYDEMADLYAAADVIVGRGGAVSVAEYAAAGRPAICLPYPYHKDNHQALNVAPLAEAGGAVLVEDCIGDNDRTAAALLGAIQELMANPDRREAMARAAGSVGRRDAARKIAEAILGKN